MHRSGARAEGLPWRAIPAPAPSQRVRAALRTGAWQAAWAAWWRSRLLLGAAGVGAGTYFGLRAFSKWHDRNANCPNGVCNDQAVDFARSTDRAALGADVSFGVGIAAVGVGTYLLLTSKTGGKGSTPAGGVALAAPLRVAPRLARDGVGLELGGSF